MQVVGPFKSTTMLRFPFLLSTIMSSVMSADVYQTKYGPVIPQTLSTGLRVFRSIPFASPPVGKLRWAAPQPPKAWTTPRNTSAFPSKCIQSATGTHRIGSEDCLYLYVYTSSEAHSGDRKPVLLWVHGGGLQTGDGFLGGIYDGSRLVCILKFKIWDQLSSSLIIYYALSSSSASASSSSSISIVTPIPIPILFLC